MHCLHGVLRVFQARETPTGHFVPSASLAWGDVVVDCQTTPTKVKIHLKKSKCDQFGARADIILGHTLKPLCPVAAVVSYMDPSQARSSWMARERQSRRLG